MFFFIFLLLRVLPGISQSKILKSGMDLKGLKLPWSHVRRPSRQFEKNKKVKYYLKWKTLKISRYE